MFFNKKAKIDSIIDVTDMTFHSFCRERNKLVFKIFKENVLPLKGAYKKGMLKITYKNHNYKDKYGKSILKLATEKYSVAEILKIDPCATAKDITTDDFLSGNLSERLSDELMILSLFK